MDGHLFRQFMDSLGLEKCILVDIGARGGVDNRWLLLGKRLYVIGFEPDHGEYLKLSSSVDGENSVFLPTALSNHKGKIELNVCRDGGKSSCFVPNTRFLKRFPQAERLDVLTKCEVEVDTLDSALGQWSQQPVDFIKLDVQGLEKNIIEGGRNTLRQPFGIEVEVEFSELYEGQPLFSDVDILVREHGFTLFDLRPYYWKRTDRPCKGVGQIVFADALYFKDPIALDRTPQNPAAVLAISTLYGKFDYAMELTRFFCDKGIYSQQVADRVQSLLFKMSVPRFPWWRMKGRIRLAHYLEQLASGLRSAVWHRSYDHWQL